MIFLGNVPPRGVKFRPPGRCIMHVGLVNFCMLSKSGCFGNSSDSRPNRRKLLRSFDSSIYWSMVYCPKCTRSTSTWFNYNKITSSTYQCSNLLSYIRQWVVFQKCTVHESHTYPHGTTWILPIFTMRSRTPPHGLASRLHRFHQSEALTPPPWDVCTILPWG